MFTVALSYWEMNPGSPNLMLLTQFISKLGNRHFWACNEKTNSQKFSLESY